MSLIRRKDAGNAWETAVEEAGGGTQLLQSQDFSLTAQEIKDSTLTPHTIIEAQGPGTLIVPTAYVLAYNFGTEPFTGSPIDLVVGDQDLNVLFTVLDQSESIVVWALGTQSAGISESFFSDDGLDAPLKFRASQLRGSIAESQVLAVGADYAVGDTGTVDDGVVDAEYVIDEVGVGDGVAAFTITDGGDGYVLGVGGASTNWTTTPGGSQPGAGSGFEVSVTEIDAGNSAGDGTINGAIYYLVVELA